MVTLDIRAFIYTWLRIPLSGDLMVSKPCYTYRSPINLNVSRWEEVVMYMTVFFGKKIHLVYSEMDHPSHVGLVADR